MDSQIVGVEVVRIFVPADVVMDVVKIVSVGVSVVNVVVPDVEIIVDVSVGVVVVKVVVPEVVSVVVVTVDVELVIVVVVT